MYLLGRNARSLQIADEVPGDVTWLAWVDDVVAVHARVLNVLQLDEEQATQLGIDVARTRVIVLAAASLVAATAVAAVSAFTLYFCPLASTHIDGMTET